LISSLFQPETPGAWRSNSIAKISLTAARPISEFSYYLLILILQYVQYDLFIFCSRLQSEDATILDGVPVKHKQKKISRS